MLEDWRPGVRVVVRRRLPGGSATDVVGTLVASGPDTLVVATERGEVRVDVADVVAAKAVPPRPARRAPAHLALTVLALEDVMADGWRALETEWLGGVGGWLLRASEGFTGRGNSALPLTPTPPVQHDFGPTLTTVRRWYAARHLPPTVVLPEPVATDGAAVPGLRESLASSGWAERTPTDVLVAAAREVALAPASLPDGVGVDLADEPDDGWLSLYRYRGQPLPPVARRLLLSAPTQVFATVRLGGATVAVGRLAVSRGWGGITAMEVSPSHRRRGLGRAVLAALARRAVQLRAPSLYLQVARGNASAGALYGSVGFQAHHRYSYWSPATGS